MKRSSKLTGASLSRRGTVFSARRRRRRVGPVLTAIGALAAGPAVISLVADNTVAADAAVQDSGVAGVGAASAPVEAAGALETSAATPTFASVDGLKLHLLSPRSILVGFHEASKAEAQGMLPNGRLVENANTTRIDPPPDAADGPEYVILSSRGRRPPPTSAADVLMRDDDPVLSPVSGTVVEVRPYALYGTYPDHRIEIQPDDAPHLRVVLIHVADVEVAAGDRVVAGETSLAGSANRFDFGSHIDRYTEPERWPHVHVEVKGAG